MDVCCWPVWHALLLRNISLAQVPALTPLRSPKTRVTAAAPQQVPLLALPTPARSGPHANQPPAVFDLRATRSAAGLSQANLARITGYTQARLSEIELGKRPATDEDVRVLAAAVAAVSDGATPDGMLLRNHRKAAQKARSQDEGSEDDVPDEGKTLPATVINPIPATELRRRAECGRSDRPRVLACFAGCGGLSLGFKQAGYDVAAFIELEPTARASFHLNIPEATFLADDIRAVTPADVEHWVTALGAFDVMCGGPPCQGFSLAGKRDRNDSRNTLFRDYLMVASVVRPRVIVMENVRLLATMKSAEGRLVLDSIREEFTAIGYRVSHRFINAQNFGVPQFRDRIFLIATPMGSVDPASLFPRPTHGNDVATGPFARPLLPYATFRAATGDLPQLESGESDPEDSMHWAVAHPEHVLRWLRPVPEGSSAHDNDDPSLRPPSGYNTTYKRLRWDEPCSTIGTTFSMISACRTVHPSSTRSITLREAMRCQTFPDEFRLAGNWSDMRRQVGNAVPPQLAKVVAQSVKSAATNGVDSRVLAPFVAVAHNTTGQRL